jgi:Mrp family chromosome partitioning ATPase
MIKLFKRRGKPPSRDPFLTLRAAVEASCKAPAVVLISSVLPGDGKTTVSTGLAVSLAKSGYPTMAIDAGSTPELCTALGVQGIPFPVKRAAEHLDVMRMEAADLRKMSTPELKRTFAELRKRYAFIVLDASELSAGGLSAAAAVDGVLLAVRSGRQTVDEDREVTQLLKHCRARFIGVIATAARDVERRSPKKGTVHAIARSRQPTAEAPSLGKRSKYQALVAGTG